MQQAMGIRTVYFKHLTSVPTAGNMGGDEHASEKPSSFGLEWRQLFYLVRIKHKH